MENPRFLILSLIITVSATIVMGSLYVLSSSSHESEGARKSMTKKIIPFESNLDNTGCGGEVVRLRSEIHFLTFVVLPEDGGLEQTTDTNFKVIEAVGLKTGNTYQVTKMIINTQSADAGGAGPSGPIENVSISFQLDGPDEGDDLIARDLRLTVNNASQVTVDDSNVRIVCVKQRIL